MDHEEYIREMFDTYLGENNVSIEKLARDCISSGKDYSDCEAKFNRELRRLAKEFQEVIGDYMGDDVVYAVGSAYDFSDQDVDDYFDNDGVAYNRKPARSSSACVRKRPASGGAKGKARKPAAKKPAKKPASKTSSQNRKTTPAKRNPTARRRC